MSLESNTFNTLSSSTSLSALVGSNIYPEKRLQGSSLPAVVYYRAPGGERVNGLSGFSGLENAMVETEISAASVETRRLVADEVIDAMTHSTRFSCVMLDPPVDDYDDETNTYLRTCQFSVWATAAA